MTPAAYTFLAGKQSTVLPLVPNGPAVSAVRKSTATTYTFQLVTSSSDPHWFRLVVSPGGFVDPVRSNENLDPEVSANAISSGYGFVSEYAPRTVLTPDNVGSTAFMLFGGTAEWTA